jgi:hypothetical protein
MVTRKVSGHVMRLLVQLHASAGAVQCTTRIVNKMDLFTCRMHEVGPLITVSECAVCAPSNGYMSPAVLSMTGCPG